MNTLEPRFETLSEKKLVGKRITTSLANDQTSVLWRSFMQERTKIQHTIGTDLFSMQHYPSDYFTSFNPTHTFEKWATIEVSSFENIPEGMEAVILPQGLYAVFFHKGDISTGPQIFSYIFGTWLPGSAYLLDNRPHFEILGERYKNNDPNSEEEIWIPVKPKK